MSEDPRSGKQVIVLVGPKGAGKTTVGHLLATELDVHFLRVEPLFLEIRDRIGATHPQFEQRGFQAVLNRGAFAPASVVSAISDLLRLEEHRGA